MNSSIKKILTSRAVITALIAAISAGVMYYTNVPEEVWIPIVALMGSIALQFTVDDLGVTIGRTLARGLREGVDEK